MFLQVNKPPTSGSCSLDPLVVDVGIATSLECKDWVDPDWPDEDTTGIQSYAIKGTILPYNFIK